MSYLNILVTLNTTQLAEQALKHVLEFAQPQAHIHLLSVLSQEAAVEVVAALANLSGTVTAIPPDIVKNATYDPVDIEIREKYLREIASWLENFGYRVTTEVRLGHVLESIICVAGQGFDLIVMASHARTGLRKLAYGSMAESVLHESPCPVLIVPVRQP